MVVVDLAPRSRHGTPFCNMSHEGLDPGVEHGRGHLFHHHVVGLIVRVSEVKKPSGQARRAARCERHQPLLPGTPLKGPTTRAVIQPP